MIDLSTTYLGLSLKNPLVCSSSPLCQDLGQLRAMEDAGASAIVLHSLFEEQIELESMDLERYLTFGTEGYAEALSYFPAMGQYNTGPDGYLDYLRRAKEAVRIPIIGSLNGVSRGGWVRYARAIEEAGADAVELNTYNLPTEPGLSGADVEQQYVDLVSDIRRQLCIPVAVKLSPFFSAPVHFCRRLDAVGANGLVLFNRFYQPDFDLEALEVRPTLRLSGPDELLLRLHWTAILYGQVRSDLAITGGVHSGTGVIKSMMAGAAVAMITSVLLKKGVGYLSHLLSETTAWMEEHEYESIRQMQGSMSMRSVANPAAFVRANYMKVLRSYVLREPAAWASNHGEPAVPPAWSGDGGG